MEQENDIVLTADGHRRISEELEHLRTVRRREVADRIRESKTFGEFAENSEYEDAKNEQAFVEGRVLELKLVLQNASVLAPEDIPTDVVGLGSKVTVRDMDSKEQWEYTIVGSIEADPSEDRISDESPVGESLMDHKVGDVVEVRVPAGKAKYKIIKINK